MTYKIRGGKINLQGAGLWGFIVRFSIENKKGKNIEWVKLEAFLGGVWWYEFKGK